MACDSLILVQNPNTVNGEFDSITDAMDFLASNYPNQPISGYNFYLSDQGMQTIHPMFNQWPNVIPIGWNTVDQDGNGNYLVFGNSYAFLYWTGGNQNLGVGQYAVPQPTQVGNMGGSIPNSIWTFTDFVDQMNQILFGVAGYNVIPSTVYSSPNPYTTACKTYKDYLINNNLVTTQEQYVGLPLQAMFYFNCRIEVKPCITNIANNPCAAIASSQGYAVQNTNSTVFQYGGSYVTGDFLVHPQTGTYHILLTASYTQSNPFVFGNTSSVVQQQFTDYWTACGNYVAPTDFDCNHCPVFENYLALDNAGQPIIVTPNYTGAWDPTVAYLMGDVFHLDWYNNGLQILLSHPDSNFVSFITSQGLSNPVGEWELPQYDNINQTWIDVGSGEVIKAFPPCATEPGPQCYMYVGPNPPTGNASSSFNDATPTNWAQQTVMPLLGPVPPSWTNPYWAGPAGGNIPGFILNQAAVPFANQSLALLNRSFVCCAELEEGCMDPTAINYQPGADYTCPDADSDGYADCCLYNTTAVAQECLPKLTKEEFLMNVAQKPETRSDVFIERGKTSVFERTQRLAQTPTIGELELHGYGYYKINEQRF